MTIFITITEWSKKADLLQSILNITHWHTQHELIHLPSSHNKVQANRFNLRIFTYYILRVGMMRCIPVQFFTTHKTKDKLHFSPKLQLTDDYLWAPVHKKTAGNVFWRFVQSWEVLWFLCVYLFQGTLYRMDFPSKLTSSSKPRGTWVPGFSPAHPLHTDCGNLFKALPPASRAQFGRLKSQRKSACLHTICLWAHIYTRSNNWPQMR